MGYFITDTCSPASCTESPFGETLKASGPLANDNNVRFSTKYFDQETALGCWGWRYYHPDTGRWPSRDPIGERDSHVSTDLSFQRDDQFTDYSSDEPLYVFALNDAVNWTDPLGLYTLHEASDKWAETNPCKGLTGSKMKKCQSKIWKGLSDKTKFLIWHKVEKADMAWTSELPSCPKTICIVSLPLLGSKATPPDLNTWRLPSKITIHPKPTVWDMRSHPTKGGHGQQCCYDNKGNLVTGGGKAPGNADRVHPDNTWGHYWHDVQPANFAEKFGLWDMYLEVRPSDPGSP